MRSPLIGMLPGVCLPVAAQIPSTTAESAKAIGECETQSAVQGGLQQTPLTIPSIRIIGARSPMERPGR